MTVSPPFAISETLPADSDLISIFPSQEHPYRDTVESWLTFISDPTTGLLKPSAFPTNVTSWVIQALSGTVDAILSFKDSAAVLQSQILWDHTNDQLSLIAYQDDGVTVRTRLDLKGDSAIANLATGALQVGGVAVVLTTYAGSLTGLVGTGALDAGSITANFGSINIGTDPITAGAASFTTMTASAAVSGTTGTFSGAVSGTTITGSANVQGTNIVSTANVFANSAAATMNLRPSGAGSTTGQMTIATNGNVTASGDLTANSDRRLKTSISPLNHQWANDMVREVQPMTFIWKRKGHERGIGFIAQDVQGYAPELVHKGENGMLALAYPNMVAILWAVVQDLQTKVEELSK